MKSGNKEFRHGQILTTGEELEQAIESLNSNAETGIYNQVYIACAAVTGTLIFLSFNYPLLFATYLMATSLFFGAWYLNSFIGQSLLAKWFAFVGMYSSAIVAIVTSGGIDHPSLAWLAVMLMAVSILRDNTLIAVAVFIACLSFGVLMYIDDTPLQRAMTIADLALVTRVHQLLQLSYVVFVAYAFTSIRFNQTQSMKEILVDLANTNKELRQAEMKAEQASQVKTQFLSNMSHEIRTPLNGLNGMLHLLADANLDEKARHYVDIALDSNKRLLELANDILDVTRIEAHSLSLYPSDLNLNEVLAPLEKKMQVKAKSKELTFHWEQEIHFPWVYVDGPRILQIIQNICDNAIKYTHVGRIAVHIHDIALGTGRRELNISVVDTGIGIDHQKLDYYMSPFTQEDMSLTREAQGAGLGLAIVNQLLVVMGGNMEVNSDRARGTQILIKIPVEIARDRAQQRNHEAMQHTTELSPVGDQRGTSDAPHPCVMLIEDDDNNIRLLQMLLRDYEVDIVVAHDGAEALDKLKTMPRCDLMFVDYYMPIMDGYEFLKRVRNNRRWKHVKAVAVTGSLSDDVRSRWASLDVVDIIAKPIQTSAFEDILKRHLSAVADPSLDN